MSRQIQGDEGIEIEQRTIDRTKTAGRSEIVDDPERLVHIAPAHSVFESGRLVVLALVVAVDVEARLRSYRLPAQNAEDPAHLDVPGKDRGSGEREVVTVVEVAVTPLPCALR